MTPPESEREESRPPADPLAKAQSGGERGESANGGTSKAAPATWEDTT